MDFHKDILKLDSEAEVERICSFIVNQVREFKRGGIVIGLSGGIDSALCAALCVRALGTDRIRGLILPEKESNPKSAEYAAKHAKQLGLETETVDITPTLEAFGTYRKRDELIKSVFPDFNSSSRSKITLPADLLSKDSLNFFTLKLDDGKGNVKTARLNKRTLNGIVAATDSKQRTRMMHLYYYAEKENYIVCGTTNRTEVLEGFFVKYGDGGVDIEPISHLYKLQVYQLSEHLEVLREIIDRAPSPDTWSFEVNDEQFYFRMPYGKLDPLLYAWEHDVPIERVCEVMDLTEEQVKRARRDFDSKYKATKHLRQLPPTLEWK